MPDADPHRRAECARKACRDGFFRSRESAYDSLACDARTRSRIVYRTQLRHERSAFAQLCKIRPLEKGEGLRRALRPSPKQAMQKANQSTQNSTRRLSQETCTNYRSRIITYHRDGTVTFWDVSSQVWARTANPTDQQLSGLPHAEVDRILRYLRKPSIPTLTTAH